MHTRNAMTHNVKGYSNKLKTIQNIKLLKSREQGLIVKTLIVYLCMIPCNKMLKLTINALRLVKSQSEI
jgi:hypothetical protein